MNTVKTLAIVAALFASQSTFAAVYDFGKMGPPATASITTNESDNHTISDYFTFSLNASADLSGAAPDVKFSFEDSWGHHGWDDSFSIELTDVSLFSGKVGSGTKVGSTDSDPSKFSFSNLVAGSYYLLITGKQKGDDGVYKVSLNTSPSATTVPEPEAYAMMLAGLGLIGFAVSRRVTAPT